MKQSDLEVIACLPQAGGEKDFSLCPEQTLQNGNIMLFSEKRKTERIPADLPLRYWVIKGKNLDNGKNFSELVEGISRNISDSGICIKTGIVPARASLKEYKELIGMEIDLFPHFKNVKAFGKPRWFVDIEEEGRTNFIIGIEFFESKNGNHKVLHTYLKNSNNNK